MFLYDLSAKNKLGGGEGRGRISRKIIFCSTSKIHEIHCSESIKCCFSFLLIFRAKEEGEEREKE